MQARTQSHSLSELIPALIDESAEFMKSNAPIMRPLMRLASSDSEIQIRGHIAYGDLERQVTQEILTHEEPLAHSDPARAVVSVFRVSYSALGRELGYGMMEALNNQVNWTNLKMDLGAMATAFLRSPAPTNRKISSVSEDHDKPR